MSKPFLPVEIAMLLALSACAVSGSSTSRFSEADYISGQADSYDDAVRLGFAELRNGSFADAVKSFESALAASRHEEPNYEPLIPLAFAHCKLGSSSEASKAIRDAACALSVEAGELKCPANEDIDVFLESSGTPSCYTMMCGDALTPYYEEPTPEQANRVKALGEDLRHVKAACPLD